MKVGIIHGAGGMVIADALTAALKDLGFDVEALGEDVAQQETAAGPNPDYVPETEEDAPKGRTMLIDIDYFQSVIGEREALAEYIAGLEGRVICKECAEAGSQELRIMAWAGAKFSASLNHYAPQDRPKWNDLPAVTQTVLYETAKRELEAFDKAQEA